MADLTAVTETRPVPLPGHVEYTREKISAGYFRRIGQVQIATATLTPGFNGTRDLGIQSGQVVYYGDNAADVAAWLVKMNAAMAGIATVGEAANLVTVTGLTQNALALAPFNPNTPDLDLTVFTVTQQAIATPAIKSGMAVVWKDRAVRTVQAPLPTSTLEDFAGIVDRACIYADDLAIRWAGAVDTVADAQPVLLHRFGTFWLRGGAAVADANPVYMGRIPAESGLWYGADDVGNTRLLVPGGQFHGAGTPSATRGLRCYMT